MKLYLWLESKAFDAFALKLGLEARKTNSVVP